MQRDDPKVVRFISGAIGSTIAELSTLPMDYSKVRMQTHGLILNEGKKLGLIETLKIGVEQHGICVFWRGGSVAVARQVTFYSITTLMYAPLRDWHHPMDHGSYLHKVMAGGIAGAIGISIANPLDVIKVRLQAERASHRKSSSIKDICRQLYATEGVRGYFRGVAPNVKRCFVVNGVEFGTYDQCKSYLIDSGLVDTGFGATVAASFLAGFAGAVASSPLDVIKTKLMAQPGDKPIYNGVLDCARHIVKTHGWRAFYKGFGPYWMREAPWCCIFFIAYESTRSILLPYK
ncbi:Mitochondrial Carrier (MC) Family [Thraustotheca clavata]|uniref:Mitochondrial Carrier (MC) Family n=1 Tax=Thraustotheca clavata TaxID=74557 RepID=A0A1W0ACY6_9STRA|nr:Mitochondrial Carrier (MC) Family [Thraustotheca clavata]